MRISKGKLKAKQLMLEYGVESPWEIALEDYVYAFGGILRYAPLPSSDGRIIFGKEQSLITINSGIVYKGKKRFTLAHELGHLLMHQSLNSVFTDDESTLNLFKYGHQETEANDFASELLMPEAQFKYIANDEKFNIDLICYLAEDFETSMTSVCYRYLELGAQPICLIYCVNNRVKYWKKSEDMHVYVEEIVGLEPPLDSLASEYFRYGKQYSVAQRIRKSTWFRLNKYAIDNDYYEYCIVVPQYGTTLSIVWEY